MDGALAYHHMLLHFNDLFSIQKHRKFYGIVVIMSPGNLLEIISAGLLDTLLCH